MTNVTNRLFGSFLMAKFQEFSLVFRSDDVIITDTKETDEDLDVEFFVQATFNGQTIVVPQTIVESILTTYQTNISSDIGHEVQGY